MRNMKKIFFALIALLCSMSMNAQIMKVMKDGQLVATYKASEANRVVFEDVPTEGSAKATINGKEVDVKWIQLWDGGPKFAEYNVGVTDGKAESEGGYYEWGGHIEKNMSSNEYNTGSTCLADNDDTATALWGSNWRMPSKREFEALIANCDIENTTLNGVKGIKATGRGEYSDNSIFLPAAGYWRGHAFDYGMIGYYWSSTPNDDKACYLYFYNTSRMSVRERHFEYSVRAVLNNHKYVDLGLPSGLKWATCNVGASNREDYGEYFAWGETEPKSDYSWDTYFDNPSHDGVSFTKYDKGKKTVLDPEDDAAHVNWGGDWRMPTKAEVLELLSECIWGEMDENGVKGWLGVGPNGHCIFLPYTGVHKTDGFFNIGESGYFWSSSLANSTSSAISFDGWGFSTDSRKFGLAVRPVRP